MEYGGLLIMGKRFGFLEWGGEWLLRVIKGLLGKFTDGGTDWEINELGVGVFTFIFFRTMAIGV